MNDNNENYEQDDANPQAPVVVINKPYKQILVSLMGFLDGTIYDVREEFSKERLRQITADNVVAFLNKKAYGTDSPGPNDLPTGCRSSTLLYYKKAISYFIPEPRPLWDDVLLRGNPTKSQAINALITKVKVHEVRGTGVSSKARRPIDWEEFYMMLLAIRRSYAINDTMLVMLAVMTCQWQLIGRIDDVMKLALSTFSPCVRYPFALSVKMCWSKNIRDERESPNQLVFGAMDPFVCPLLNLVVYLEGIGVQGPLVFGKRSNRSVSHILERIFLSDYFKPTRPGLLGTHSIRKGAATFASRYGLPRDWVNLRGRWRGKKQQVDTYIDVELPYPDARVAAVLTGPRGPCKYSLKDNKPLPPGLLEELMSNTLAYFPEGVAKVLVLPLLWAAFEGIRSVDGYDYPIIPMGMAREIKDKWFEFGGFPTANPVEKIGLSVQQLGDQLVIVPLASRPRGGGGAALPPAAVPQDMEAEEGNADDDEGVNGAAAAFEEEVALDGAGSSGGRAAGMSTVDTDVIFSQQFQLQERIEDLRQELLQALTDQRKYFQHMNSNIRRIAIQPVVRPVATPRLAAQLAAGGGGTSGVEIFGSTLAGTHRSSIVKLSKNPRDLWSLWKEWEFGIHGTKPAKDFSRAERGANKHAYSRRKVFWDCMKMLIAKGYTSDTAIDRIYSVYGRRKSNTEIIKMIKEDIRLKINRFD